VLKIDASDADPYSGDDCYDACFVAGTMVTTESGERPIESVVVGDYVLTRGGYERVLCVGETGIKEVYEIETHDGTTLIGTGNHPVWIVGQEWKRLDLLENNDILLSCKQNTEILKVLDIIDHRSQKFGRTRCIFRLMGSCCIERFGKLLLGIFQGIVLFITRMAIRLTMKFRILSVLRGKNILNYIGKCERKSKESVKIVDVNTKQKSVVEQNSVQTTASLRREGKLKKIMKFLFVVFVRKNIGQTNIAERRHVHLSAERVKGLKLVGTDTVYNITVENTPEYFANKLLVHNCRYFVMNRPQASAGDPEAEFVPLTYEERVKIYTTKRRERLAKRTQRRMGCDDVLGSKY